MRVTHLDFLHGEDETGLIWRRHAHHDRRFITEGVSQVQGLCGGQTHVSLIVYSENIQTHVYTLEPGLYAG